MTGAPTVVLADDHPVFRMGVRMTLVRAGFTVLAEAVDRDSAVEAVLRERPDLCVLALKLPGGGIEAAKVLYRDAPATSVVMLSASASPTDMIAAFRAGAKGYLTKDTSPDGLPSALAGVLRGEAALPRTLTHHVLELLRELPAQDAGPLSVQGVTLTARESEVLRMLRAGLSTIEISERLSLSPVTVRRHISSAVTRLGAANRDEAIRALA
jgi:DNA-binding NarL/FixJ family response regulator